MTAVTVEREPTRPSTAKGPTKSRRRGGDRSSAGGFPASDGPVDLVAVAGWPLPVSRVEFDEGLAFIHAAEPGGYSPDDLDEAPDDGRRYELLDGVVVVSPSPGLPHQRAVVNLVMVLRPAEVGTTCTLVAPYGVPTGLKKKFEPDVLVLPDRESTLPVLAVEVLSKYGRTYDRKKKRAAYEQGGIGSYWIVDPNVPEVTVLELAEGGYREVGVFRDDEAVEVDRPYPVRFRPADLLN
jgi:Uma2 family endonuclease